MVRSIQALRGVAALLVLLFHVKFVLGVYGGEIGAFTDFWRAFASPFEAGVDLFFVVSGFIMVFIRHRYVDDEGRHAGTFLIRRAERVIPPYWVYTTIMLGIAVAMPHSWVGQADILKSYLLIPYEGTFLLFVGWTLVYEMLFYTLFAATLIFVTRQTAHIAVLSVIMIGLVVSGIGANPDDNLLHFFYAQPIILEFVAGMIVGHLYTKGWVLPPLAGLATLFVGIGLFVWLNYPVQIPNEAVSKAIGTLDRVIEYGIAATLIVLGVVGLEARYGHRLPRLATELGDASYSLYLSHILVLHAVGMIWRIFDLGAWLPNWILAVTCVVAACLWAILTWHVVEVSLLRWAKAGAWRLLPQRG